MARHVIRQVRAVALTAFLAACTAIPHADDGPTRLQEWQSMLPDLLEHSSDYQADILADGIVTRVEHDAAFAAMKRCLEQNGVAVVGVEIGPEGEVGQIGTQGDTASFDRCRTEFFSNVKLGYDTMLNPDLTPGGLVRALVACLRENGVTRLPADAENLELAQLLEHFRGVDDSGGSAHRTFNECYDLHG